MPTPTPTPEDPAHGRMPTDHYWLDRPFADDDGGSVDRVYPYGSTELGALEVHHGVEFPAPQNRPIQAVADGTVIVAGDDSNEVFGLSKNFYGNLVVVQLDRRYNGQPVFNLYGHLDRVAVQPGQRVHTGEIVGEVGMTGVALGPHLHFEVRVGQNDYWHTRNPELWIKPRPGTGTIAGRALDHDGRPLGQGLISLHPANTHNSFWRQTEIYGEGVNPDDALSENFLFGDVPAGDYILQLFQSSASIPVHVTAGETVVVVIRAE